MSHPSLTASAPSFLQLFIKGPLKEGLRFLLLAFGFYLGLWRVFWTLALGFLVWEAFRREKNY
jgi:hypothetical protein